MEAYKKHIWSFDRDILAKIAFAIGCFMYLYDIPFSFLPYNTGVFISMIGWVWFGFELLAGKRFSINVSSLIIFSILLCGAVYSYLYTFLQGTHDNHVGRLLFLFLILFSSGAGFIGAMAYRLKYSLDDILYLLVKVIVVQALLVFVMFAVPDLKLLLYGLLRDGDVRSIMNVESGGVRGLGLSYGTTWDLSVTQSLGLFFIVLLIPKKNTILLAIFYLLIVGSMIITGRTGFLGAIFSILLLAAQLLFLANKRKVFSKTGKLIRNMGIMVVVTVTIVYNSLSAEIKDIVTDNVIPWAFELFINKSEGGSFETSSSNELKTMYFPVSASTFLFGDGYFDDPDHEGFYYMGTDAGYMRHMLYYGVFGSSFLYGFYLLLFVHMAWHFYKRWGILYSLMVIFMAIYFFVAHIKGDILMGGDMPVRVVFILYFYLLVVKSKNQTNLVKI